MSLSRYALLAVALTLGSLAVLWPLVLGALAPAGRWAVLFGAGLALANTVAAFGLVRWSESRAANAFVAAVLGGMVTRMGVMLGAVAVAVLLLGLPQVPLVVSLLGYFAVFLVLELRLVSRPRPEPAR
jgi:hypothetical protein